MCSANQSFQRKDLHLFVVLADLCGASVAFLHLHVAAEDHATEQQQALRQEAPRVDGQAGHQWGPQDGQVLRT